MAGPHSFANPHPLEQAKGAALVAAHAAASEQVERGRQELEELAVHNAVLEKMLETKDDQLATLGRQPQGGGQPAAPAAPAAAAAQLLQQLPPEAPAAGEAIPGEPIPGADPQLRRHPSGADLAAALPMSDNVKAQLQSMTYYPVSFVAQVCGFVFLGCWRCAGFGLVAWLQRHTGFGLVGCRGTGLERPGGACGGGGAAAACSTWAAELACHRLLPDPPLVCHSFDPCPGQLLACNCLQMELPATAHPDESMAVAVAHQEGGSGRPRKHSLAALVEVGWWVLQRLAGWHGFRSGCRARGTPCLYWRLAILATITGLLACVPGTSFPETIHQN